MAADDFVPERASVTVPSWARATPQAPVHRSTGGLPRAACLTELRSAWLLDRGFPTSGAGWRNSQGFLLAPHRGCALATRLSLMAGTHLESARHVRVFGVTP